MDDFKKNADRFNGFADIYDRARPGMPYYPVSVAERYFGGKIKTVADLGCGTGLSTLIWQDNCEKVIGIEPGVDMLAEAKKKENGTISFRQAFAHETGLENGSVEVAICSQSFHWMEPELTLKEVDRILKPNGVFMTVDCDWPPVVNKEIETAYTALTEKIHEIEGNNPDIKESFRRWDKNSHLSNIKNSGFFSYSREIVFINSEKCGRERILDLILSQGSTQAVLGKCPELISNELERFKSVTERVFNDDTVEIGFCYRIRLGVK